MSSVGVEINGRDVLGNKKPKKKSLRERLGLKPKIGTGRDQKTATSVNAGKAQKIIEKRKKMMDSIMKGS